MKSTGMLASAGGSTGADHAIAAWSRSRPDDSRTATRRKARTRCTAFSRVITAQDESAAGRVFVTPIVARSLLHANAPAGRRAGQGPCCRYAYGKVLACNNPIGPLDCKARLTERRAGPAAERTQACGDGAYKITDPPRPSNAADA